MRSNPSASEGVVDPRARTSILQGRRRKVRGDALVEEVGVDGRTMKSESVLTVYLRRGVKRKLPGWTGQTSP